MELKFKKQKIRDLFVYNTNIMPLAIDTGRTEVVITIKKSDLDRSQFTTEGVIAHIARVTGRKITLHIKEDE